MHKGTGSPSGTANSRSGTDRHSGDVGEETRHDHGGRSRRRSLGIITDGDLRRFIQKGGDFSKMTAGTWPRAAPSHRDG